jgi:hypothetical protein
MSVSRTGPAAALDGDGEVAGHLASAADCLSRARSTVPLARRQITITTERKGNL